MNRTLLTSLIILAVGGLLGYYGNVLANKKNNDLLVQMIKDQITCTEREITGIDGMQPNGRVQGELYTSLNSRLSYLQTLLAKHS